VATQRDRLSMSCDHLKGPKLEIFGSRVFTQIMLGR
jgi:hypothetical protein